jgi:hypothetical protein
MVVSNVSLKTMKKTGTANTSGILKDVVFFPVQYLRTKILSSTLPAYQGSSPLPQGYR